MITIIVFCEGQTFESLLFSDIDALIAAKPEWRPSQPQLETTRRCVPSPEHINDGPQTHPSARLSALPGRYQKRVDGPRIAARIGLHRIRQECAHFHTWVTRLEKLQPL